MENNQNRRVQPNYPNGHRPHRGGSAMMTANIPFQQQPQGVVNMAMHYRPTQQSAASNGGVTRHPMNRPMYRSPQRQGVQRQHPGTGMTFGGARRSAARSSRGTSSGDMFFGRARRNGNNFRAASYREGPRGAALTNGGHSNSMLRQLPSNQLPVAVLPNIPQQNGQSPPTKSNSEQFAKTVVVGGGGSSDEEKSGSIGSAAARRVAEEEEFAQSPWGRRVTECVVFECHKPKQPGLRANVFVSKDSTKDLADHIVRENWGHDNGMLYKYLDYIFRCQIFEGMVRRITFERLSPAENAAAPKEEEVVVFATGLQRRSDHEFLFFVLRRNDDDKRSAEQRWRVPAGNLSECCLSAEELLSAAWGLSTENLPQRTRFYENVEELLFAEDFEIEVNWAERLRTNKERIFQEIRKKAPKLEKGEMVEALKGPFAEAMEMAKKKAMANPRLTVAQGFVETKNSKKRVELLLPLKVEYPPNSGETTTFALALQRIDDQRKYQGMSLLTMSMAYANARLVGYVDSNWLTEEAIPDKSYQAQKKERRIAEQEQKKQREAMAAQQLNGKQMDPVQQQLMEQWMQSQSLIGYQYAQQRLMRHNQSLILQQPLQMTFNNAPPAKERVRGHRPNASRKKEALPPIAVDHCSERGQRPFIDSPDIPEPSSLGQARSAPPGRELLTLDDLNFPVSVGEDEDEMFGGDALDLPNEKDAISRDGQRPPVSSKRTPSSILLPLPLPVVSTEPWFAAHGDQSEDCKVAAEGKQFLLRLSCLPSNIGVLTVRDIFSAAHCEMDSVHLIDSEKMAVLRFPDESSLNKAERCQLPQKWKRAVIERSQYLQFGDQSKVWQFRESTEWAACHPAIADIVEEMSVGTMLRVHHLQKRLFIEKYNDSMARRTNTRTANQRSLRRVALTVWTSEGRGVEGQPIKRDLDPLPFWMGHIRSPSPTAATPKATDQKAVWTFCQTVDRAVELDTFGGRCGDDGNVKVFMCSVLLDKEQQQQLDDDESCAVVEPQRVELVGCASVSLEVLRDRSSPSEVAPDRGAYPQWEPCTADDNDWEMFAVELDLDDDPERISGCWRWTGGPRAGPPRAADDGLDRVEQLFFVPTPDVAARLFEGDSSVRRD